MVTLDSNGAPPPSDDRGVSTVMTEAEQKHTRNGNNRRGIGSGWRARARPHSITKRKKTKHRKGIPPEEASWKVPRCILPTTLWIAGARVVDRGRKGQRGVSSTRRLGTMKQCRLHHRQKPRCFHQRQKPGVSSREEFFATFWPEEFPRARCAPLVNVAVWFGTGG